MIKCLFNKEKVEIAEAAKEYDNMLCCGCSNHDTCRSIHKSLKNEGEQA